MRLKLDLAFECFETGFYLNQGLAFVKQAGGRFLFLLLKARTASFVTPQDPGGYIF